MSPSSPDSAASSPSPAPPRSSPAAPPASDRRRGAGTHGRRASTATALAATALVAVAGPLPAQQPADTTAATPSRATQMASGQRELVDRIVAVVGDTTIALSEVREEVLRLRQQGMQLPQDPMARDSVVRSVLDRLVRETVLLEQAKRMGISVPQEQVQKMADSRFSRYRSNFDSDQALRKAVESTGQNMFQFREMLRARSWAELTLNRLRQQLISQNELPSASVSEDEIRRFFEQNAAGRQRPGAVSFDRVMVSPRPDSAAADSARALAQEALDAVRGGTEFAVAARRYSDDSGTRDEGGDLGWVRRSALVPAFGDASWAAPPGRAVGPVRSRLGYHVIKVENVRGGERRIRHILIRPRITEEDVEEAHERARALADSLRQGADADRLARRHGLPGEQVRFEGVRLNELGGRLGDAYAQAIGSPSAGDVLGPFEVQSGQDVPNFAVLEIRDFTPTGEYRLEDVRDQIRQQLLQQKQFSRYVTRLRNEMHVRILI